ncbi:hypothetical protein MAR_008457 [Mya arenaria]|uniref:Uncharacterized protein n=1 Tax=Mya arenaria TaxID=6604 RepID=A0ABY7DY03_MYAAR|nr:hypothetical protein MAR_008457 [Mya arenaria]
MLIVYVMREEIALANHPLQKPNSWYRYHAKGSLWTETYKVNDDLELSDVDEDSSPWRSPFLVKVAVYNNI